MFRLIEHTPTGRDRVALVVLYVAGLRISEACGLRWRDVRYDGEAAFLTVLGKGGKTRTVRVEGNAARIISDWRGTTHFGDDGAVFASRESNGGTMNAATMHRLVKSGRKAHPCENVR